MTEPFASYASTDDTPDYMAEYLEHTLLIDQNGEMCNPTVFHPTQAQFENAANEKQHHKTHAHNHDHNVKEKRLARGAQRAREILHERRNIVSKTEHVIDRTSQSAWKVGICMTLMGVPYVGLPLMFGSICVNHANHKIAAKGQKKLDSGLEALAVCTNEQAKRDDKIDACEKLKEAAKHIRYWEKTRSVTATAVKFAFGELHTLVSGVQLAFDLNSSLSKPKKPTPTSSESLQGALSQVYYGMGIKHTDRPKPVQ